MILMVPLIYIAGFVMLKTTGYKFKTNNFIINDMEPSFLNPICIRGGRSNKTSNWYLTIRQINKVNKIENGNIGKNRPSVIKKLKILHLNKGSKFLANSNELKGL